MTTIRMYKRNEKILMGLTTTDGITDIVISAVTSWTMTPNGNLLIFLKDDTIFTVSEDLSIHVQDDLRDIFVRANY